MEALRRLKEDDLIGLAPQLVAGAARCHWRSNHHTPSQSTHRSCRSRHRRPGGKTVIDKNDGAPFNPNRRTLIAV